MGELIPLITFKLNILENMLSTVKVLCIVYYN